MCEPERRTIEELVIRYEFEPSLKDIFVEGAEDKAIIEGVLEENGVKGVVVFEISSVEIPTDYGEENNNRTRVIKLSRLLGSKPEIDLGNVVCVVDSDFDFITGGGIEDTFLLKTDYANMEMYLCAQDSLEKVSRRCLRKRRLTNYMYEKFMVPTLQTLFLIRFVNSQQKWRLQYLSFERLLKCRRGRFSWDRNEYLRRYLNKNGRVAELEDFLTEVDSIHVPDVGDARRFIHGHDFIMLLMKMMNELLNSKVFTNEEVVLSLLKACTDYSALFEETLFKEIKHHLSV